MQELHICMQECMMIAIEMIKTHKERSVPRLQTWIESLATGGLASRLRSACCESVRAGRNNCIKDNNTG